MKSIRKALDCTLNAMMDFINNSKGDEDNSNE